MTMWTGCDSQREPTERLRPHSTGRAVQRPLGGVRPVGGGDRGETPLVMPAVAVAEANHLIGADHNAWSALLYPADVTVVPLDSSQATLDIGLRPGGLVARHVVY